MLVADKYQQGVDLMRSKVLLILMIVIPVTVFFVFGAAAGIYCIINRSTDEVPDSSSLYVYAVDREFGELNQSQKFLFNNLIHIRHKILM